MSLSMLDRFWAKVDMVGDCWLWTAAKDPNGYGRFGTMHRRTALAHRVAYELHHGPIPSGLDLDHLCRNTSCVNPEHLEPVSHQENMRRGFWGRKSHCPQGHEYTPENTYRRPGDPNQRLCRTCMRHHKAVESAERRAATAIRRAAKGWAPICR